MDKVLVTLLLIIAGVVCSLVVMNAVYPAITGSSGAITDAASKIDDRIRSQIKIIEIATNDDEAYVWIKNIGASQIKGIESSDIFFGTEDNLIRVQYGNSSSTKPYWSYVIENGAVWDPSSTLKVTIYSPTVFSGSYTFKMVIPNGIYDEGIFSAP